MKVLCTLAMLILAGPVAAQPMAGQYMVGGAGAHFATCADAVAALLANGVSGQVIMNLRPGIHEPTGPGVAVIDIPSPIAGVSAANLVTFQPDFVAGGTAENVILQVSQGAAGIPNGLMASVASDHVAFHDLSFVFADTSVSGRLNRHMVHFYTIGGVASVRGARVSGCRFFGRTANGRAHAAVNIKSQNYDFVIENNVIDGATVGVAFPQAYSYAPRITGNTITGTSRWLTGASADVGEAISLGHSVDAVVSHNLIDYAGGASGYKAIAFGNSRRLLVDANQIICPAAGDGAGFDVFFAIYVQTDGNFTDQGATITNNAVTRLRTSIARGLHLNCDNLLIAHNSVVAMPRGAGTGQLGPLYMSATGCTVMNNLFIELASNPSSFYAMVIVDSTGNTFDHNDLYSAGGQLVRANATNYSTLAGWQAAGHGANSVSMVPAFVDINRDLHLGGCSATDPALLGVGLAGVGKDLDGEIRDPATPLMGADEVAVPPPSYFGPPVAYEAGAASFLMISADLDGDTDLDLAFTNSPFSGGSNDVTLMFNNGSGSFSPPVHHRFAHQPNIIRAGHLNNDAWIDLVVSSETADSLLVRFGTGGGAFGPLVLVDQVPAITDVELADYDIDGDTDILFLVSPSTDSGYVNVRINDGTGTFTWNNVAAAGYYLDDLTVEDLNGDGLVDLAVVDKTSTRSVTTALNLGVQVPGVSLGFAAPVVHLANVSSTPQASRFMTGDFDGDLDVDMILGDGLGLDSLVLLRNDGSGGFGPREAFFVSSSQTYRLATALDYEGDGDLDIVTANNTLDLHLLLNDGAASFDLASVCDEGSVLISDVPQMLLAAPFDADSDLDLAILTVADTVEVFANMLGLTVSVGRPLPAPGPRLDLAQNVPNPAFRQTVIGFRLPRAIDVRLEVFSVTGQRVATLLNERRSVGAHVVRWDGGRLPSGTYFYRLSGEGLAATRRMTWLR